MKWILGLLIGMLIAYPAVMQVTHAEGGQIADFNARILAELQKINAELVTVKTDIAVMKTDIAALKTELHETKTELKAYVDVRITAQEAKQVERDKRTQTETRMLGERITDQRFYLLALLTVVVGGFGYMSREMNKLRDNVQKLQETIARLQAGKERIKAGILNASGKPVEDEDA